MSASSPGEDTLPPLHPDALADLRESGLRDATIARSGLHSVRPADLKACRIPGVVHALAFPYNGLDGTPSDFQRWKLFYGDEAGDRPKYWQAKGSGPVPYLPPLCDWTRLASDPTVTLLIGEGEKKVSRLVKSACHVSAYRASGIGARSSILVNG
jgi:hypothetical protein